MKDMSNNFIYIYFLFLVFKLDHSFMLCTIHILKKKKRQKMNVGIITSGLFNTFKKIHNLVNFIIKNNKI